ERAGRGDLAGDERAVAVVVHRIGVVVDKVVAGDDAFAPAAAEVDVVVVDARIEDGDAVAFAAIGIVRLDGWQPDDAAEIGRYAQSGGRRRSGTRRDQTVLEDVDRQGPAPALAPLTARRRRRAAEPAPQQLPGAHGASLLGGVGPIPGRYCSR